jgi:phosphatidylinositol kinase/protein kinase (PI-3  family)
MQLFSLVNNLLIVDSESFRRNLNIRRYPIIPLAPNAGLGGWVQESDTLHVLVRDYREARKVLLNIEYRLSTLSLFRGAPSLTKSCVYSASGKAPRDREKRTDTDT